MCFKRDVMDTTLTSFAFCVFFFLYVVVSSHGQHFPCSAGVSLRYTMAELLQLRLSALTQPVFLDLPKNIKPRKRGRQSGVRRRNKPRQHKPYLPAIIMGNVQSLGNKLDALSACVKFQHEYRTCSIMCYTETWLSDDVPDSHVNMEGFSLFRSDRTKDSGKKNGGGVCL